MEKQFEQALALRALGRACAATGAITIARQHMEGSLALLQATGGCYEAARTTYRLAELEKQAGNLAAAHTHCTAALATFQELGAQKDRERAQIFQQALPPGAAEDHH